MSRLVAAGEVVANVILLVPNAMERTPVPVDTNTPVVKLKPFKFNVPAVNVVVPVAVNVNVAAKVVVIPVPLIVNPPIVVLVFGVIVPVPTVAAVNPVNEPPEDNIKLITFTVAAVKLVIAVVPKLRFLNQLRLVNVGTAVPLPVNVKLGAFVIVPPVVPNVYDRAIEASEVNPPVPVYENPVTFAIDNTVLDAPECANTILLDPNVITLVLVLVELNIPVVNVNPPKSNVPAVNVVVLVADKVNAAPKVVVYVGLLIFNAANVVLPALLIVPVPTIFAVKLVNVPLLDNVRLFKFSVVAGTANAVVPKSSLLNQLRLVNVAIAVPLPVNVKLGEISAVPPVVPNVNVLVIFAAAVNPPVPVKLNPVTVAIDRLTAAAVVVDNTMLLVPNAIERVLVLLELNVPIVKSNPPKLSVPNIKIHTDVAV